MSKLEHIPFQKECSQFSFFSKKNYGFTRFCCSPLNRTLQLQNIRAIVTVRTNCCIIVLLCTLYNQLKESYSSIDDCILWFSLLLLVDVHSIWLSIKSIHFQKRKKFFSLAFLVECGQTSFFRRLEFCSKSLLYSEGNRMESRFYIVDLIRSEAPIFERGSIGTTFFFGL